MRILLLFGLFGSSLLFSQQESCDLKKSEWIEAKTVDKNDILCVAKNSGKPNTVFYTLASWCVPCIQHLPDALALEKEYNTDVYVVLVEGEDDRKINNAIKIVKSRSEDAKILVLKNTAFPGGVKKRNRAFAEQMTPPQLEMIPDFSKFIVVNHQGEVKMVTNWKDYRKPDKKTTENVQQMLAHTVIPLIK
ncbi:MAG: hypothetical protein LBE92_19870 [Chryseobacterium sp.]|jgi:thiol-disulfide isomerase/thioredoxin|uniref:TlpA family protein disulfide reductase n=1 Tax=Chryseobacterium sp. TaxID=1871047 RepID=UPI00281D1DF6|nr:hypothetical protein [Chryseobacterium sp.]MDR2238390.1 hypothetical protein [Chryseobacterium sp.]